MKHATFFISVVALSSLFLSCKQSTKFLRASSMANEVVVVMDDNVWENGEAGRACLNCLIRLYGIASADLILRYCM